MRTPAWLHHARSLSKVSVSICCTQARHWRLASALFCASCALGKDSATLTTPHLLHSNLERPGVNLHCCLRRKRTGGRKVGADPLPTFVCLK